MVTDETGHDWYYVDIACEIERLPWAIITLLGHGMQACLPVTHASSTTVCSGNSQKGQLTLGPSFPTTRVKLLAEAGLRQ